MSVLKFNIYLHSTLHMRQIRSTNFEAKHILWLFVIVTVAVIVILHAVLQTHTHRPQCLAYLPIATK